MFSSAFPGHFGAIFPFFPAVSGGTRPHDDCRENISPLSKRRRGFLLLPPLPSTAGGQIAARSVEMLDRQQRQEGGMVEWKGSQPHLGYFIGDVHRVCLMF